MTLADLGWNDFFDLAFQAHRTADHRSADWVPARLIRDNKISYGALTVNEDGAFDELEVILSGKVYHDAETNAELPAVGDWVALDLNADEGADAVIRARLPRQTCFSRKAAGQSAEEQVLAANVDHVVVITEPGSDFSLRRLERYFTLIRRSGAAPVIVLNKADLHPPNHLEQCRVAIQALNPEADVLVTSVIKRRGLAALKRYLAPGRSVAFIGSSGVGKSAMINHLLGGEYQWTSEVNDVTGKGRHTTTARELMVLKKGGIVIDNPGIKEVHLWTDETILREHFDDIARLTDLCQFRDCKHGTDLGCAIRKAVEEGHLEPDRYLGFLKLDDEIAALKKRRKKRQMTVERRDKRDRKVHARNREDRDDHERHLRPRA